ncbi:MAG TPA: N-acetylmuramoyl-L-alanine amidase [Candidatus Acidoferrales bacterium]|jgi:N-acetylmuramoyl-L-alanine amidase|nr:N-acetylmuramoyl-L-alanine amidase [Candidatus Acidoferrales bacterium]
MKRIASRGNCDAGRVLCAAAIAAVLALCFVLPVRADRKSEARDQFERSVKMRTMLEGYLEKDRSLAEYRQTISAYHKVYLISTQAVEVTPSLIAEGELYQEMGRLFDPKYFQSAIDAYNFLLKQYPESRYRGEAMLAIAQIQNDDLDKPADAEVSYKEYVKRFPRSDKAKEAREALKEIAAGNGPEPEKLPDTDGQRVDPRVSDKGTPSVTGIQTWNAEDSTHIVVALDDTIKYDSVRIAAPDRIYFDLYKAKLGAKLPSKQVDVQNGLLKSIRVAQNKPTVVRIVLDVNGAKDFSAYLLAKPYRLVIDVRSKPVATATNATAPATIASVKTERTAVSNASLEKPSLSSSVIDSETVTVNSTKDATSARLSAKTAAKVAADAGPIVPAKKTTANVAALGPPPEPKPTREGDRSLTRALGLKISRIVIDAGHGGHDTGTIGPHGLMEKDLCLDVALRLGTLIEQKLPGAEVIYTRKDDTFIPLEQRTSIANEAKADLFISIHANSSHDPAARGIETYYLNFATSAESMEVASRENANSQESLHDLQDLIQKIARNEKIEESKELASDIQDTLTARMQLVSHGEKNRGVKKAPFVVLIGANMPSVLSEISFVSNPGDEKLLRKPDQRQRIADGLYRGVATYLDNLNSLTYNKQKLVSENHLSGGHLEPATVVSTGNPK